MEKDKYDKQPIAEINPNELYEDICNEVGILEAHLDLLQAIVDHGQIMLNAIKALDKASEISDLLVDIESRFPTENVFRNP